MRVCFVHRWAGWKGWGGGSRLGDMRRWFGLVGWKVMKKCFVGGQSTSGMREGRGVATFWFLGIFDTFLFENIIKTLAVARVE